MAGVGPWGPFPQNAGSQPRYFHVFCGLFACFALLSNKAEPVGGNGIGKGLCLRKICGKSLLLVYRQQWAAVIAPQSVCKTSLNWAEKPPFQLLSAPGNPGGCRATTMLPNPSEQAVASQR